MDVVDRLRRMADMTTTGNDLADIGKAADEIERLRIALAPLADVALWRDHYSDGPEILSGRPNLTPQEIRAARAALGKT